MEKEINSKQLIQFMDLNNLSLSQKMSLGQKMKLIEDFEPELMERLKNCFYAGSSAYIFLVMENTTGVGKCWDKSIALTLAMDDFNLVRGSLKTMEEAYGKENDLHYWVEQGDIVYDATDLKKYQKWFYYYINGVSNISVRTQENLFKEDWYMQMRENGVEDFLRFYFVHMPLLESIIHSQGSQVLINELERLKQKYGKDATEFRRK